MYAALKCLIPSDAIDHDNSNTDAETDSLIESSLSVRPQWNKYKKDIHVGEDEEISYAGEQLDSKHPRLRGGVLALLTYDDIPPERELWYGPRRHRRYALSDSDESGETTEDSWSNLEMGCGSGSMAESSDQDLDDDYF